MFQEMMPMSQKKGGVSAEVTSYGQNGTSPSTLSVLENGKHYALYVAYGWGNIGYTGVTVSGDITDTDILHQDNGTSNSTASTTFGYFNSKIMTFTATGTDLTIKTPTSTIRYTWMLVKLD